MCMKYGKPAVAGPHALNQQHIYNCDMDKSIKLKYSILLVSFKSDKKTK